MLKEKTIVEYCQCLGSDSPTPGGGSSLALVVLNGICLVEMSCNVTLKKLWKVNQTSQPLSECLEQLQPLKDKAMQLIDLDATAFQNILVAWKLPKSTQSEMDFKTEQLQNAYIESARTCLTLLETAVDAFFLSDIAIENSDKYVESDALIGKQLLKCAGICQRHNIEANSSLITDATVKNQIESKMLLLLEELDPISFAVDEIS